jgi:carbamoylphosphate synthase large subunit
MISYELSTSSARFDMSNVLLVDTNFSSGPIYHVLRESGHCVSVIGSNPDDALAKSVDDYINLDYSDIKKIKQVIAERKIEYLVPGCNDRSYLVCAEINSDGRFPSIDSLETAEIINSKDKFRSFAVEQGLPTPRVLAEEEIGTRWPVIVKPVDAFSGRGVSVVHERHKGNLPSAIISAQQASRSGVCIVEDYVEGQLYSHSAFIQSGEIVIDFVVEEHGSANPFVVDTSRVLYDFSESMLASIQHDIRLLTNQLNLKDGLIHTQFISNGSDYWLIEVTRRCPGDLYSQLIELSTGFPYAENYALPFLGMPFRTSGNKMMQWVMRHTLTQSIGYTLGSISFNIPLKIIKWVPISRTGDKIKASPFGRIGIMFSDHITASDLDEKIQITLANKLYAVEK